MNDFERLLLILEKVTKGEEEYPYEDLVVESENLHFTNYKQGENLVYMGFPVENILIQIKGDVSVYKYSIQGRSVQGVKSIAPQIFGLYELLCSIENHSVTLQAMTEVSCVAVPMKFFKEAIEKSHQITLFSLQLLAVFTNRMLSRHDQLTLHDSYENLLLFLYERSLGKKPPITIEVNKKEIAEAVNTSERSLYRQLDRLEEEGLIKRLHGKIQIDKNNLLSIQEVIYLITDR